MFPATAMYFVDPIRMYSPIIELQIDKLWVTSYYRRVETFGTINRKMYLVVWRDSEEYRLCNTYFDYQALRVS